MKVLLTTAFCFLSLFLIGQKKEGKIEYKETIKMEINFDGMEGLTEEMKAMIPSEQSNENVLYFNKEASFYTNNPQQEEEMSDYKSSEGGMEIQIQMDMPKQSYYHHYDTKEIVESQDLFGKTFLITGAGKNKWKLTNETQKILTYNCKKATMASKDGKVIEAWFTTDIPLPIGPSGMHSLPGAVLKVVMEDGQYTVEATAVAFEKVAAKTIVKPKKGKKVTHKEYEKIVEAKQKEMAEMYGNGGNVIIQTETR